MLQCRPLVCEAVRGSAQLIGEEEARNSPRPERRLGHEAVGPGRCRCITARRISSAWSRLASAKRCRQFLAITGDISTPGLEGKARAVLQARDIIMAGPRADRRQHFTYRQRDWFKTSGRRSTARSCRRFMWLIALELQLGEQGADAVAVGGNPSFGVTLSWAVYTSELRGCVCVSSWLSCR